MKLAKMFIQELNQMFKNRDFRELLDIQLIKQIFSKAPKRLLGYYDTLISIESQCLKRTVCDVAAFTSTRIPKWFEQILVIYFTTFSEEKPYYKVVFHGLSVKDCALVYPDCNPEEFLERLRSNITQTVVTTVAPFKTALQEFDASLELPTPISARPNINRPVQQHRPVQQGRPEAFDNQEDEDDSQNNEADEMNQHSRPEFEAVMNERHFEAQQQHRNQQHFQASPSSSGQFRSFQ